MPPALSDGVKSFLYPALALVALLAAWELAANAHIVDAIIFPSFSGVVDVMIHERVLLLSNLVITVFESMAAFIIGAMFAFLLALAFEWSVDLRRAFLPYAIGLKATPLIALAPLIILWAGNGLESKIVMGALVAFFPVLVNSLEGLRAVAQEPLDLMKSFGASPLQTLLKIRIPHAVPFVFSSLKIASTLAVVGVVIGEFTGATQGLGHVIVNASYYLEAPLMFAAILLLSLWGVVFYGLLALLENQWKRSRFLRIRSASG